MKKELLTRRSWTLILLSLLLSWSCLSVANAQSIGEKKVTMDLKGASVKTFFYVMEKQTGLNFICSADLVKSLPPVIVKVNKKPALEVLDMVMASLNCKYVINGTLVTVTRYEREVQNRSLSGLLTDEKGEILPGVSVRVEGANIQAVTDDKGHYSLKLPVHACSVVYSFIGMKSSKIVLAKGTSPIQKNVRMFSDNTLNEVVVTGYQTISKERVTGSFSKVTADELKTKRYDNLSQLLEGEVPGFNTSSSLIRGTTTMNGDASPLYVIDGFPVENTRYNQYGSLEEKLPQLNIEDIKSITVLKDAAAASIYGARAANGVVVIVTKKAEKKRTSVSFSSSLTWHPYSFYDKRLTNASDMIDLEKEWAQENPNLQGGQAASYAQSLLDNKVYTSQGITNILNYYAGNLPQSTMEDNLNSLASRGYQYYKDVSKYAKRDAFYQQYYLTVGRGSEHNNFTASVSYRNNRLNDRYSSNNAWGVDLKDILDLNRWLTVEVGDYSYFNKQKTQTFDPLSENYYSYEPYDRLKNSDGTNYTYTQDSRLSNSNLSIIKNNGLYNLDITPLDEISRNIRNLDSFTNRIYGKLNANIFSWLKYNVMFQYEYSYDKTKQLYDKESYYVRQFVDKYATSNGTSTTFNVPYGDIYYRSNQTSKAYTFRQQLNFDRTFGGIHNIVALLGHEVRKNVLDYDNSTLYDYDPQMLTYALVNQGVLNSTYGLLGGYGLSSNDFAYLRYIDNRYISVYANAAYTYDDRYMATASIRWDRSNLWGTNSKYQKNPIWSLGAAWNINREKWFHVSWIDRLKFRLSYGIAGNVAKNAAPYMTASYFKNTNVGGTYGSVTSRPNPNLRWEKTTTTNIAFDFAVLHNRLSGSIEYYNKMGVDLLANTMGVPTEGFGYNTYMINNGKMRNQGIELSLNGQIINTRDFGFNVSTNFSYNKNKVVYVNVTAPVYYLQLDYPQSYPVIGNPYTSIYAYKWAGLSADGLPQVYGDDGKPTTQNPSSLGAIKYVGSTEPSRLASVNLDFHYRDFDFSCLWVYKGGYKMRNTDLAMLNNSYNSTMYSYMANIGPVNKNIIHRWRTSGDEHNTDIPRAVFGESPLFSDASYTIYSYSDINVIDASNLRLANVSLSYALPRQWISHVHLSNARFQMNMENVFTFAHSKSAKYLLGGYNAPNYVLGLYLDF